MRGTPDGRTRLLRPANNPPLTPVSFSPSLPPSLPPPIASALLCFALLRSSSFSRRSRLLSPSSFSSFSSSRPPPHPYPPAAPRLLSPSRGAYHLLSFRCSFTSQDEEERPV